MTIRGTGAALLAAAWLAVAGAAPAAVAAPDSGQATPQCLAASHFCGTPVMYAAVPSALLGMTATSSAANAPVIAAPLDESSFSQDWTFIFVSRPPGSERAGQPASALAGRIPVAETVFLEFSPAGALSDRCAANVRNKLVLRRCNGSNWQLFIMTAATPGGRAPPPGWLYFLSAVIARAIGQHLALTGSRIPGRQLTFAPVRAGDSQFWGDSLHCVTVPRRPSPVWLHEVC